MASSAASSRRSIGSSVAEPPAARTASSVSSNPPWVRAVSKGVFCAYILHQTVIVLLTQALRPVALPWGLEALLVLLLTFGLCALAYLGLRRVPLVRGLVGITAP